MKKKFKLITTIMSFFIMLSVMGVGIWAATTHTLAVSTTVSFTATQISGTIYGTITGVATPVNYYKTGTTPQDIVPAVALPVWTIPATSITASNSVPSDIVFTIVITNTTPDDEMTASIPSITCGTNLEVKSVEQKANLASVFSTVTNNSGYTFTNPVANNGTLTIKVTIKVSNVLVDVSSAVISYSLNLGRAQ